MTGLRVGWCSGGFVRVRGRLTMREPIDWGYVFFGVEGIRRGPLVRFVFDGERWVASDE